MAERVDYRDSEMYRQGQEQLRVEEEQRRLAAIAAGQPLATNVGMKTEQGFFNDTTTPITAYYLDPASAGQQSTYNTSDFYGNADYARMTGRQIGGQQQSLADVLRARSEGRGGPSLAELQLAQTLEQNKRDAAGALQAAGRTINPALAQRLLMQQRANLNQQAAGQAAITRAGEQQAAQTALANQLAQMRGAETSAYQQGGSLGLNQEQLGVQTQENQRQRELDIALANQRAAQTASGQASTESQNSADRQAKREADIGTAVVKAAEAAAAYDGGIMGMAKGGRLDPKDDSVYITKDGKRTKRGIWANVYLKNKREGKADGGKIQELKKMDNEKNDTVPAMLSPGEIVIPRSIVAAPNPGMAAHRFVEALLANKDKKEAKTIALKAALSKGAK